MFVGDLEVRRVRRRRKKTRAQEEEGSWLEILEPDQTEQSKAPAINPPTRAPNRMTVSV